MKIFPLLIIMVIVSSGFVLANDEQLQNPNFGDEQLSGVGWGDQQTSIFFGILNVETAVIWLLIISVFSGGIWLLIRRRRKKPHEHKKHLKGDDVT